MKRKQVGTCLISIPGTLVVIRKRDDGSADSENHRWMNFTVSVSGAIIIVELDIQIVWIHGDHGSFFLQSVKVFDHTLTNEILPAETMQRLNSTLSGLSRQI